MVSRSQQIALEQAQRSIEREGRAITLAYASVTPTDPAHPSRGTTSTPQLPGFDTFAVFTRQKVTRTNANGVRRQTVAQVALVSAVGVTNAEAVKFIVDVNKELTFGVADVDPVEPGEIPIIYKFILEG